MKNSLSKRYTLLIIASLFALASIGRAIVAVQHYRLSLAIIDDPSIRELEQVSAFLETGACLILLAHAAVLAAYTKRTLKIIWPLVAVTGLLCATIMAGSFAGLPIFNLTSAHAVAIVTGVVVACMIMRFNWASLYLGALLGSTLGWLATTPLVDVFVGLFVVGPASFMPFWGVPWRAV
ncbi:MAG: hypothetical protein ABFS22_11285 [Pseudomonadota bacterium]